MNKLIFALIATLSAGYASASDSTVWGGDLDGKFEPHSIGAMHTMVRHDPSAISLDGDFDEHASVSGVSSDIQVQMGEQDGAYADLDGNSDLYGGA